MKQGKSRVYSWPTLRHPPRVSHAAAAKAGYINVSIDASCYKNSINAFDPLIPATRGNPLIKSIYTGTVSVRESTSRFYQSTR
jgi:hypothetical protein